MAEHASYAAIAQQLDEVRTELAVFRARLDQETGPVMVVQAAQKRQREKVEDLEKKVAALAAAVKHGQDDGDDEPTVPRWDITDQAALATQFAELRDWVEGWLRIQFPGYLKPLPDCWGNHGEALWELGTLHAAWKQVLGGEDQPGLEAWRWWLERWLPDALVRLRATVNCSAAGCSLKKPQAPRPPRGGSPVDLAFRGRQ